MNVLILTPDAVGSTLLQRMLTIYMQLHHFDRPVINLHELTNGLAKYYSPEFNRELVGKRAVKNWGYYQSLEEIVGLLGSVDHYKTSRLAHYHIRNRGDTVAQQIPFYNYLNENFYIIACRRANVFEHALSMTLNQITKKLNVYTAHEKIDAFYNLYKSGVQVDVNVLVNQLDQYKQYLSWSSQYFNVGSYFNYESDMPRIEQYILNLPVFAGQHEFISWEKNFNMSFNTWNKIHYEKANINRLLDQKLNVNALPASASNYQQNSMPWWPPVHTEEDFQALPVEIKEEFKVATVNNYLLDTSPTLLKLKDGYKKAENMINDMVNLGIIISGPPIKKQTMSEKKQIIKNFDQCLEQYNQWAEINPTVADTITDSSLALSIEKETYFWSNITADRLLT
jgi:hypothetical protein